MANTGLTFTADGSGDYLSIIKKIQNAASKLDKAYKDNADSSDKFTKSLEDMNKSITSSSRRLNGLIDKMGELDVATRVVIDRMPELFRQIERGLSSKNIERAFADIGDKIGDEFLSAFKKRLGIRSPSQVFIAFGQRIVEGLQKGISGNKVKKVGNDAGDNLASGFTQRVVPAMRRAMETAISVVTNGVATINRQINTALNSISSAGASMMTAGTRAIGAGLAIGGITLGGVGLAVNTFASFEDALVNSQSIMGATNEEMALIQQQLLDIGGSSQAGSQAAAESFYAIVSGVQDATIHMDILNAAIATSEAGQAELTATTSGLISVMNSYGGANLSAAQASDVFSRTVQMGVGTMDGFVSAMSPIAGLANSVGVSFDEVGSAMAFMTAQGATTGAAATRLQASMVALLRPNTRMAQALQTLGYESGQAAIEELGLVGALDAVNNALDGNTAQYAEALGSVEALQGAVALLDDGYADFNERYQAGLDGATESARAIQLERTNAAINDLKSSLGAMTTQIGAALAPVVEMFARRLTGVVDAARNWMSNNKELTDILIRVGSAIGIVVSGLLVVGGVIATVAGAAAVLSSGAIAGLLAGFTSLVGFIFSSGGIIAGLAAVASYFTLLPAIIGQVQSAFSMFGQLANRIGSGLNAVFAANTMTGDPGNLERENDLLEQRQQILDDIAAINEDYIDQQTVQIQQGDTLWDIAQEHGITVQEIIDANGGIDPRSLSIGQEIVIPVGVDNSEAQYALMNLEEQLAALDSELAGIQKPPVLADMSTDFNLLATSANSVVDGLLQMATGDVTGGLDTVKAGIEGIKDAVSGLWDSFVTGFLAGGNTEPLDPMAAVNFIPPETPQGLNPIIDSIEEMIQNAVNFDFSALLGENPIAVAIEGIVDGALDGLDIQTMVSDLTANVSSIARQLRDGFMNGFNNVLGGGQTPADFVPTGVEFISPDLVADTGGGNPFQRIIDMIQPFLTVVQSLDDTVGDLLPGIVDGISGFFSAIAETIDLEQLGEASGTITGGVLAGLVAIGTAFTNLLAPFIAAAEIGGAALINGISEALPSFGTAIGELVNSLTALLSGDFTGAFESFSNSAGALFNTLTSFTTGAADGAITAIENLTGVDLPSVDEGFTAWANSFSMASTLIEATVNGIRRNLSQFVLDTKLMIFGWLNDLNTTISNATGGTVNIAPDLDADVARLEAEAELRRVFEEGNLNDAESAISLATSLEIDVQGIALQYEGQENFEALQEAVAADLATAAGENDEGSMQVLIPMAIAMGVEADDVTMAANEAGVTLGDEVTAGLHEALGIQSPSQVAIDAGLNVADAFTQGFQLNLFKMAIPLGQLTFMLGSLATATVQMGNVMRPVQTQLAAGFQSIADSASGLWKYLRSIKIMMEEIGLSPGEAVAAVNNGTGADAVMAAYGGGRREGGDLSYGSFYEINEGGIPEVAVINGRTYLFPAGNGFIQPAMTTTAGNNTVNNNTGGDYSIHIGAVTMVVQEQINSPEQMQEMFFDAIEAHQESRTVGENMRDTL